MNKLVWTTVSDYRLAPSTCGVYQYWQEDKLLYVGKAINIKARLAGHAQNAKLDAKERAIVTGSTQIRYTLVESEFLALLLESKLIRESQPPYNRIWKDDKTYLYIVIDLSDPFPRPRFARGHDLPAAASQHRGMRAGLKLFGPFPSSQVAEEVLREIRRLIPFCMSKKLGKRPCFYSKIGLCSPCPGSQLSAVQKRQYRHQIQQVIRILSGNITPVITSLTKQLKQASKQQDFETALVLRTKIERFTHFVQTHTFRDSASISYNTSDLKLSSLQKLLTSEINHLTSLHRIECYDASNSALHDSTVSLVVATDGLLDRGQYRRFRVKNPRSRSDFDRLFEAVSRRLKHSSWPQPDLIVIDGGTPQLTKLQPLFDLLPEPIPLLGLAKHPDRLVFPDGKTLKPTSNDPGFLLLQELRNEAHRFANSYRRVIERNRTKL
ncbi:MAG: Excinuclease ABC C subunit domain protein [Microgenomates group bacterium GW2011_GWD1_47_13]|nr:MAG: Excinuclease ABC C subunit domain protein [Microgenomates group bacterium GW2011_GWF2_46_18]KKU61785.1 MAG: Excinuclease ABC C subunit domain protein [Microgenomates group bacterium GW2011_GWD1_47_13]HBD02667.1 hypothetical protein [Candidatus Collierbacteria bacterium]